MTGSSPAGEIPCAAGAGTAKDGLYLYALAEQGREFPRGITGIDGEPVRVIPCRNMAAIVHACPLEPYTSDDKQVITGWVLAHQRTLELMLDAGIPLIPFSFDTIIRPSGEQTSTEVLFAWLSTEYEKFEKTFDRIRNKKEYGIQVFCRASKIRDAVAESDEIIRSLQQEVAASGPGKEFLLRQKMEKRLKTATDEKITGIAAEIMEKIRDCCDDIKPGRTQKGTDPDLTMIMNCSCLVSDDDYPKLGEVLESVHDCDGLTVRFTGPWAAYSFV